ncbi:MULTISPECIES: carbon storage regulator [unclassified Oleiphilus]|uniref:carbon storage regulator n=1 Tax=unclassified Oleiphilus TaxID=2631174 RepID=UPI0007C217AD|nr:MULTISPECIES: carbon storage regulator [unclassified Oleiphilus]KZY32533.1 hypothetical protein A3729_07705 [Oleiphilus sp. HI0043]KZZ69789.1 hypothetical protein A3763_12640 [Oleiphilus sp. HI0128]
MKNGFLNLSRKSGEEVFLFVGDTEGNETQIRLVVTEAENGQARLAFQAPANVDIWREELLD